MLSAGLKCDIPKPPAAVTHREAGEELLASLNAELLAIEAQLGELTSKSHAGRGSEAASQEEALGGCSLSYVHQCCRHAAESSSSAFSSRASSLTGDESTNEPEADSQGNHFQPLTPRTRITSTLTDGRAETGNPDDNGRDQAAMPRRSRSLVDDARMETQRNKQLLDEIRSEQLERQESHCKAEPALGSKLAGQVLSEQAELELELESQSQSQSQSQSAKANAPEPAPEVLDEAREIERCLIEFPRHISELDHCNHLLIKYEPELDPTHPGFHDLEYRARRKEVAEVAFNYRHGERIPEIAYSAEEQATWKAIYLRLKEAYGRHACAQHNLAIRQLEEAGVYSAERVPQLQAVSEFLERKSGWRLRPVAGLLSARDFLASLAFRVFQTTQYIRHWANPDHSVEPDCIHELMGHIPMLCDAEFAHFSQELGLASLGASDEQIERFATLYWFTVEFGLCQEAGQLKCYGAGLLSSYGEMEHALESGKPQLKEFVPEQTALEAYDDSEYQVVYYVARSFEDAKAKIKLYASKHLKRDFELAYDPYTCSVLELRSCAELESFAVAIRNDMARLCGAIGKLKAAA